jgi:hypothetical protein
VPFFYNTKTEKWICGEAGHVRKQAEMAVCNGHVAAPLRQGATVLEARYVRQEVAVGENRCGRRSRHLRVFWESSKTQSGKYVKSCGIQMKKYVETPLLDD